MLKSLRWPLLVFVLAAVLFVLALLTRSNDTPGAAQTLETSTPLAESLPTSEPTAAPTLAPVDGPETAPAAQTQPTPVPSQPVLVEALVGQISKLNPLLATYNPVDRDITSLIYEGLTATNDYGEIVPDLATSWTVSDDGLVYLVELRTDVLWQDGIPFTAEDVVFTVSLLSDPAFPGAATLSEFWRTVEVDALSSHLVRFRLTQPLASFPDQMRIGLVPKHALDGVAGANLGQHPFNLSPIGTGPYQIETLTTSSGQIDGIQLRVAPVYRQRPEGADGFALDRLVFRTYPTAEAALDAYQNGEVNSLGTIPADALHLAEQMPGLSVYAGVAPRVGVVIYNWHRESVSFVRNPRVRLGLAQAVDRATVVQSALDGTAILADTPLLPNSWAYDASVEWPAYDPAHAQELIATANLAGDEEDAAATAEPADAVAEGGEGAPVSTEAPTEPVAEGTAAATEPATETGPVELALVILTLDDPALVEMATQIAGAWQQVGVEASIDPVDSETLRTRLETGEFDAALVELSFEPDADPDPYVFWHQGQYGSGQNYGGMDDRRISEALEQARRVTLGLDRKAYYQQFQHLFAERAPALVLYNPLWFYGADSRLQGVQVGFLSTASDRFRNIHDWTFD
ncbi:ABC transporter substrate-binding protein [Aggregatilinea lenta]|uniref:ABC transporter substrate-binding protein n=1 Tax=Aggregatilinea lenta TaxID=913108 RepID=UPI000E5AC89E|nr:ABC transporter substrate-binding protein [Aggregatilinea lenta]